MIEHPIIFSTEMVKAILDGRKTQTRRVVKPTPAGHEFNKCEYEDGVWVFRDNTVWLWVYGKCPYGQVGDRFWVRETWLEDRIPEIPDEIHGVVHYKADDIPVITDSWKGYWRPSIFMPRWASRIDLEITGIRVERLQEINTIKHDEVYKEGYPFGYSIEMLNEAPVVTFAKYWDTINAKRGYSWESNPWVWVLEFKNEK